MSWLSKGVTAVFPIKVAYNEYKYLVSPGNLENVIFTLDAMAKGTDPYPDGVVESCYYDSLSLDSLTQCKDGSARKVKFRIRRYDGSSFGQIQVKSKNLYGVGKIKCNLPSWDIYPDWYSVLEQAKPGEADNLKAFSSTHSPRYPVVNVRYRRRRYQFLGYRITLDSNIEAFPYIGLRARKSFALLPYSILEIKSESSVPILPAMLKERVAYGSFSKYAYLARTLLGEEHL